MASIPCGFSKPAGFCPDKRQSIYRTRNSPCIRLNKHERTTLRPHSRSLSPDNYVQAPDFTQNFNRYSYVLNNPLKYTDPDGEWIGWDDAVVFGANFVFGYVSYGVKNNDWGRNAVLNGAVQGASGWLAYNTMGLSGSFEHTFNFVLVNAMNTYMNTTMPDPMSVQINDNWSFSVNPSFFYSTEGFGAGIIAGVHYTDNEHISVTVYGSFQYGEGYVSGIPGTEYRIGGQFTLYGKKGGYISIGYNHFFSGETSQNDWVLGFGGKKWSFQFEEDYKFSDKYRTGAAQFGYKYNDDIELSFGFKAYTGKPKDGLYRFYNHNGKIERCYINPEAYKYLSGVLYAGVNYKGMTFQAGMNSEKIRGFFQNGIHSMMNNLSHSNGTPEQVPHFYERPNLNPNSFYYNFGKMSPYSLYP